MKLVLRIALLCLFTFASLARAQDVGPEELIKGIIDQITAAVSADKQLAEGDKDKAVKLAEQKILSHIDFEEATRLAASRAWPQASVEQRRKLVNEFRSMLVRTYSNAISVYTGQEARLLPSRSKAAGAEATVRYQFVRSGGRAVHITYEMRRTDQGWKIYDISVEGMSLVLTYRTEFDSIVKHQGVEGLIRRLAEKNGPAKIAL
jgi:phospholipid transport system substrate-binding protein